MLWILIIVAFSLLRRAHGSKFYGLIENNTVKRILITGLMSLISVVYAGHYSLIGVLLIGLYWLWLAPGVYLAGVDGDWKEAQLMMLRQCYAAPAVIFYALYCHQYWMSALALLTPFMGYLYWMVRFESGDKVAKAEFLGGAFMGLLIVAIGS